MLPGFANCLRTVSTAFSNEALGNELLNKSTNTSIYFVRTCLACTLVSLCPLSYFVLIKTIIDSNIYPRRVHGRGYCVAWLQEVNKLVYVRVREKKCFGYLCGNGPDDMRGHALV